VLEQLVAKLVEVENLEGEVLEAFLSGVVSPEGQPLPGSGPGDPLPVPPEAL
jgi:hypothetical protein